MATTTITTSGAEDSRMAVAFGAYLQLGRNATQAEIKADVVRYITKVVKDQETIVAIAGLVVNQISPT